MRARERFERSKGCIVMEGFDGEYYIFNEENREFFETDEMGAFALNQIDGRRRFNQIVDTVHKRFMETDISHEEISAKLAETFEAAKKIGALRKKSLLW